MSKKHHKPQAPIPAQPAPTQNAAEIRQPSVAAPLTPVQTAPSASRRQIAVFWSVTVLAVALAWILDYMLPGVPERVVERWIMLAFGIFLVCFLYKLK